MKNKITTKQAAELMGVSEQFVRYGLRSGKLPFGAAVQVTGKRYSYYISPDRFYNFIGRDITIERR